MAVNEKPHKKLLLWEKAMGLVVDLYRETKSFPREEEYGLKSQMRRAAVSVPSNIAEGLTRSTTRDKLSFLNISRGSLHELDAQIEISEKLQFLTAKQTEELNEKVDFVGRLLTGVIKKLRSQL